MTAWLRKVFKPKADDSLEATARAHDATIRRADRLLRITDAYRREEALRRARPR